MKCSVEIVAQVEWATEVEVDSREQAEEIAREEFEMSQATNSTFVELINSITVIKLPESGESSGEGESE